MKKQYNIRKPDSNEIDALTSLAMRSKAYWGYDYSFMRNCVEELTVTHDHLNHHTIYLMERKKDLVGFYVLQEIDSESVEMTFMFVKPELIGLGIGKKLFEHATIQAKSAGFKIMIIQSDPFASPFYEVMGCKKIGVRPSNSINGRKMPLYSKELL